MKTSNHAPPTANRRQNLQASGLTQALANAYRIFIESGTAPSSSLLGLVEKIAEESYRTGIETMADIVQPDFAELSASVQPTSPTITK